MFLNFCLFMVFSFYINASNYSNHNNRLYIDNLNIDSVTSFASDNIIEYFSINKRSGTRTRNNFN
jgi:hypothetical protein